MLIIEVQTSKLRKADGAVGACNGACHHYENINKILTKC